MLCPFCQASVADRAFVCPSCDRTIANPFAPPGTQPGDLVQLEEGSGGSLIPTRNPAALVGYYLGLFSCTPLIGLPMAIVALVYSVKGFRAVRARPSIHGAAHAWIGLICGSIGLLINLVIVIVSGAAVVLQAMGKG